VHYYPDNSLFALGKWLKITCNVIITFYQLKAKPFLAINDHIAADKRKSNLNNYEHYVHTKKSHIDNKYCLLYRKWYAPQFGRLPSGFQSSKHGRVVPILLLTTLIMNH